VAVDAVEDVGMALLEVEQVEKHFGGLAAVNGVTMRADDGEILAIVGPNGAGKSTLLKLIVGLEAPTKGAVRFAGEEISHQPPHRIRQLGVAMVQQTPRHFATMSVLENVAVGALFGRVSAPGDAGASRGRGRRGRGGDGKAGAARALAGEALALVGLADRRHDPVSSLNLHEQRFLELARAMAGEPRLLVLDEVMAGLNEAELAASMEMVRSIRDELKVTIIWVEHVMKAVVSLAERTVVLNFGTVLAEGAPKEVMRQPAVVAAYLGEGSVSSSAPDTRGSGEPYRGPEDSGRVSSGVKDA
jgi:ABC-type branched-subunit amino acid transport system ATPase component